MDEKRKGERLPINIKLTVSNLYKEGSNSILDLEFPVEVTDISSKGMGFISECILPTGYYFIANIELAEDLPQIITDVRIIRANAIDKSKYHYGCEFVAISHSVQSMLDEFAERL